MSKKDKSKPSPFGLPSFKDEKKETDKMTERMNKNMPDDVRRLLDEARARQKNK